MQILYSFKGGESENFSKDQKFLLHSIDNMYNLYLLIMSLLIEVHKKAEDHVLKTQNKLLATTEDKNPNKKLINNEVFLLLRNNEVLQEAIEAHKITNWELDDEYVDIIFRAILASDLYADYMQTKTSTFKEDKNFLVDVFKEIIAPNEKLYEYIEDKNLTWLDDLPIINTTVLKLLKQVKANPNSRYFAPHLYKDADDKAFAIDLLKKTILNQSKLSLEIEGKTKNWDAERIARIDYVLLQMGICELQNFPSIPVKVTINEYLEIAKEYSTPKSSFFINGVLDKLVKEYQVDNKLNKIGRGLL
ncbi:transcription antitermination factor NusB [Oceanihabitans sediminis]|uniref:Transcription antitermination factor NusB n=1 Tax=Oceanihabitans sediminis TaxID=1812012 RepID=A0A368P5E3_9FLAO|nr:transcription antitermination factor NusB [Oceanihabitans sediminis]MDX1278544.1 transcription antitermination factor NusB [Oceanihabitans sediminis]MDX1774264.1 transcription antitermination factor NusB [Oceanihabitans sediminis]RCU57304.1 transcription antitermination factor NusB [Oceanihabitans sediminis]